MSELKPGGIVWAKCGALHWPAELVDFAKLPEDIRNDFKSGKEPQFVVKFFDEDGSYEFLKNDKNLFPYNCDKKEDFIKKGIVKSRTKSKEGAKGWFEKFPEDVIKCEKLTGGDPKLLEKEPYIEKNDRIDYSQYFGDQTEKQPKSGAGGKRKGNTSSNATPTSSPKKQRKASPTRPISHPRFRPGGEQHSVRIMQQPSTPVHLDLLKKEESKAASSPGAYTCQICGNSASRINVIMMCTKMCNEKAKNSKAAGNSKATNSPKATPKKTKATPAKETSSRAKSTPKAKAASTPAKATPKASTEKKTEKSPSASSGRGRGRGRPAKAAVSAEPDSTPAAAKSTPKEKKPRMTKKKKDEMAKEQKKKLEERKKILGEWDEEEDGEAEAEEKKKIKDLTMNNSDGSDIESEQEAYFQEDNIQGNIYDDDDDDEEMFEDRKDEKAEDEEKMEEVEAEKTPEEKEEKEENTESAMESNEDISKLLEETKVPELPNLELAPKKGIKFAETIAKEFAMTKMALVQPKSNMAGPMDVEDEFMEQEFEEETTPTVAKSILKRKASSPPPPPREPSPEPEEQDEEQNEEPNQVSTSTSVEEISSTVVEEAATVTSEVVAEKKSETIEDTLAAFEAETTDEAIAATEAETTEDAVAASEAETTEEAVAAAEAETTEEAVVEASSAVAAEAMLALQQQDTTSASEAVPASSSSAKKDGDTLYLVMDDSMNPNQLDQQTFYIDPNQLANKDLSNVVLTTEASVPSNGHHQQSQEVVATNGSSTETTTTSST